VSLTLRRRWLYWLHICQDANFRLSNRIHARGDRDPPLQPGSAFMVDPTKLNDYVRNYIDEKEVCSCDMHLRQQT
jgi:hypothetical protein